MARSPQAPVGVALPEATLTAKIPPQVGERCRPGDSAWSPKPHNQTPPENERPAALPQPPSNLQPPPGWSAQGWRTQPRPALRSRLSDGAAELTTAVTALWSESLCPTPVHVLGPHPHAWRCWEAGPLGGDKGTRPGRSRQKSSPSAGDPGSSRIPSAAWGHRGKTAAHGPGRGRPPGPESASALTGSLQPPYLAGSSVVCQPPSLRCL